MSFSPYLRIIAAFVLALCAVRAGAAGAETGEPAVITYAEHIRPILERSCVNCHQPGQIAPMPLQTYAEVRPWAKSIKAAVVQRTMPPFHASGPLGRYVDDPRLTSEQIQLIAAWVEQGCPPGPPAAENPELAVANDPTPWRLGEPDIILEIEPYEVRPGAKDDYTLHFLDFAAPEELWISGVEVQFDDYSIVHHANVDYLKTKSMIEREILKNTEPVRGEPLRVAAKKARERATIRDYHEILTRVEEGRIDHFSDEPTLDNTLQVLIGPAIYGWLPGTTPRLYPPSGAKILPKGMRLALECHYAPREEPVTSRARIGLYLLDGEITEKRDGYVAQPGDNSPILIQPGQADYRRTFEHVMETDALIDSFGLHMHYRGVASDVSLVLPNGESSVIFEVPRYDFNWQRVYWLKEPILAPKGSRLIHTARWDNSSANPANPDPSQLVKGGFRTVDEMWASTVEYTIPGAMKEPIRVRDGRRIED